MSLDTKVSSLLANKFEKYAETTPWMLLENSGSQIMLPLIMAVIYFLFQMKFVTVIASGVVVSVVTMVMMVLKPLIGRKRPIELDHYTHYFDHFSFPSGHAARGGALVCFLVVLYPNNLVGNILIILWVVFIGLSRIVSREHYFFDVLGGYSTGAGITGVVFAVAHYLRVDLRSIFT